MSTIVNILGIRMSGAGPNLVAISRGRPLRLILRHSRVLRVTEELDALSVMASPTPRRCCQVVALAIPALLVCGGMQSPIGGMLLPTWDWA